MRTITFFLISLLSFFSEAREIDLKTISVKNIGYGTQPLDSDLEFVQVSLGFTDKSKCKFRVGIVTAELKSIQGDNPLVEVSCEYNGESYLQSTKARTEFNFVKNFIGGQASSFNVNMKLVDNKGNFEDFEAYAVLLTGKNNSVFLGKE